MKWYLSKWHWVLADGTLQNKTMRAGKNDAPEAWMWIKEGYRLRNNKQSEGIKPQYMR
jgi:hypothetical protein